jgi:hypothetical protein
MYRDSRRLEIPTDGSNIPQRHYHVAVSAQGVAQYQLLESHFGSTNVQARNNVKNPQRVS